MYKFSDESDSKHFSGKSHDTISNLRDFFTAIFDNSPTTMFFLKRTFEVSLFNSSAFEMFDCSNEFEFKSRFFELSPTFQPNGELSSELASIYIEQAYETGSADFEWMHRKITGDPLPVKINLKRLDMIRDSNNEPMLLAFMEDLTPFKREQDAEKKINEKVLAILDATPLCLNVWNSDFKNVMCNNRAMELFDIDNKEDYLKNFALLSPLKQPNGVFSTQAGIEHIKVATQKGYNKFNWLHCKLNGEEIPTEITLVKIGVTDEDENELIAGFTRDLRPQFAGHAQDEFHFDSYFLNHISDKILFNVISDLSDEWFFALDIRTSLIQYFGKGKESFGISDEKEIFPHSLIDTKKIHKDDIDMFRTLAKNMKNGIYEPIDLRFINNSGVPHYYRIIYKTILDNNNKPIFSIGKAVDIHEQKTFEMRSKTDLLTNCYNKVTAETLIADAITENGDFSHALFIIDIDNFKAINDNLGHHFGDLVLSEVASNLRACFRNADIVGRIGGDEFIVFLKNINDASIIQEKAEKIARAFQNTYSGENNDYKISGSIGISRYPNDGHTYEDLYKASDKALYQSKLRGKDCYTFYSKDLLDGTMKNRTTLENANRIANSYFDAELVSTVFNLMYETKEMRSSLNAVMQFIGKRTNADRCYIFETFDGGKTYDNTYEWCDTGIVPEIDNLQGLSEEILSDFFENSDSQGIFYSNDLSLLVAEGAYKLMADQGIKSFLHVQTTEKDHVKMFLGIDDCTRKRVWNEKEINSILYAAKMISIFLLSEN